MSFIMYFFVLIFVLPIILALIFAREKWVFFIFLAIPFLFILAMIGWWVYESNDQFVRSTDLAGEGFGEMRLLDPFDTEVFAAEHGEPRRVQNILYPTYNQYRHFSIGTNEEQQIIYMRSRNPELATQRGIQIGDTFEEAIEAYGKHYYDRREMGISRMIGYVDRENLITIEFVQYFGHNDETINDIRIYYDH